MGLWRPRMFRIPDDTTARPAALGLRQRAAPHSIAMAHGWGVCSHLRPPNPALELGGYAESEIRQPFRMRILLLKFNIVDVR